MPAAAPVTRSPAVKFTAGGTRRYRSDIAITITENGRERRHHTRKTLHTSYVTAQYALHELNIRLSEIQLSYEGALKKSEGFLKQLSGLYADLSLYVNWQGAIHSVLYPEKLWQRWETLRPRVEKRYKGGEVQTYLDGIGSRLQNPEKIRDEVQAYRFLGLLFPGLCEREETTFERPIQTALLHDKKMSLTETWQAGNPNPETRTQTWRVTGAQPPGENSPWRLNRYEGHIFLDTRSGWVTEARLQIAVTGDNQTKETLYTLNKMP